MRQHDQLFSIDSSKHNNKPHGDKKGLQLAGIRSTEDDGKLWATAPKGNTIFGDSRHKPPGDKKGPYRCAERRERRESAVPSNGGDTGRRHEPPCWGAAGGQSGTPSARRGARTERQQHDIRDVL